VVNDDELARVTEIVANLYDFTDGGGRGRRVFIQQSGLGRFLTSINLDGSSGLVAADLVFQARRYGYLEPEAPTKHALGGLLSYVVTLGELAWDDKKWLAGLIVKYSLIADPAYLNTLRDTYKITETVVEPPAPQQMAPSEKKDLSDEPAFTVEAIDEGALESIINSEDNFLDVSWLFGAIYSARAVCRIELPEGTAKGTGFLIGPNLLLTNQHVLQNENYVKHAVARFDYRTDDTGIVSQPGRPFEFEPGFYFSSSADKLDYALVRLQKQPLPPRPGAKLDVPLMDLVLAGDHRGYLVMKADFINDKARVNIIQHPDGDPMKAVMTQNYVRKDMSASRVQYVADTMGGSSGSPVFNSKWEVVALHHSGSPYPPPTNGDGKKEWKTRFRVNEGIPCRAILEDFKEKDLERYLPQR
jgi:V8-like Glu-specific endopeptidase